MHTKGLIILYINKLDVYPIKDEYIPFVFDISLGHSE